jgi:hypothetical protein
VFDEGLSLVWKKNDSYVFKGQGPRDNIYVVDETGNVSILSLLKDESIISLIRKYRNLYTIYRYTHEGTDFNEYPITLERTYIRGINIVGGEQGELICAGLYSESFDVGIRGTFFFKIDPATGLIYDRTLNPFDNALLSQLAESKEPMLRNMELINYFITDMVLRSNGRIIIIAEQVFEQTQNTYNNLLVTCYDSDGRVYWTRVIRKRQDFNYRSVTFAGVELQDYRDFVGGFRIHCPRNRELLFLCPDGPWDKPDIILFFNDHIRNLEEQKINAFQSAQEVHLLAVTVDEWQRNPHTLVSWKKRQVPGALRFYDTHRGIIVDSGIQVP